MKKFLLVTAISLLLGGCGMVDDVKQATNTLSDLTYKPYEGTIVGSTVIQAASMYYDKDISIYVTTGVNTKGYYAKTGGCYAVKDGVAVQSEGCQYVSESDMKNQGDSTYYVNPFGTFDSTFYKDENGVIKAMLMRQHVNR